MGKKKETSKELSLTAIRIKKERESIKDLSQTKLAAQIGVSENAVSHWEQGIRNPQQKYIIRMSDLFGVSVDYLLGRSDNRAKFNAGGVADDSDLTIEKRANNTALKIIEIFKKRSNYVMPVFATQELFVYVLGEGNVFDMASWEGETLVTSRSILGEIDENYPPFAITADSDLSEWGIQRGAKVVINPVEQVNNYDVALIFYHNKPAIKKIHYLPNNEIDLISSDGKSARIITEENVPDVFKIAGKAITAICDIRHGI